jgi:predicted metal-binding transcription factor (methanogenesis marker protein 9)
MSSHVQGSKQWCCKYQWPVNLSVSITSYIRVSEEETTILDMEDGEVRCLPPEPTNKQIMEAEVSTEVGVPHCI